MVKSKLLPTGRAVQPFVFQPGYELCSYFCFWPGYCQLNGQITGAAAHVFRSSRVCISTNAKWESIQMLCKYLNADNAGLQSGVLGQLQRSILPALSLRRTLSSVSHILFLLLCNICSLLFTIFGCVLHVRVRLCMKYSALQFGKCHNIHTL